MMLRRYTVKSETYCGTRKRTSKTKHERSTKISLMNQIPFINESESVLRRNENGSLTK